MTIPWWCECCGWVEILDCEPEPDGLQMFCHSDNLPAASGVYRVGGRCYQVNINSEQVLLPGGVGIVDLSGLGRFDTCAECESETDFGSDFTFITGGGGSRRVTSGGPIFPPPQESGGEPVVPSDRPRGVRADKCDPNSGAPDVWVFEESIPVGTTQNTFLYRDFCYATPSGPIQQIPEDAIALSPVYKYDDCASCGLGIRATICPEPHDYVEPAEIWVKEEDIPSGTGFWFWQVDGMCYQLDLSATPTQFPPGVRLVKPKQEYDSCDQCFCGELTYQPERGIPFVPCEYTGGQQTSFESLWLLEADIPAELTITKINDACYYVDPDAPVVDIPVGSRLGEINNTYETCGHCHWNWIGNHGGGIDPNLDLGPGWPLPPLPKFPYNKVVKCSDGTVVGWVDAFLYPSGFVYKPGPGSPYVGQCLEITNEQLDEDDPNAQPQISLPNPQKFFCCEACEDGTWTLINCETQSKRYTDDDLTQFEGQIVKINQEADFCWQVFTYNCFVDDPNPVLNPAVVFENYPDCVTCLGWWKLTECTTGEIKYTQEDPSGTFGQQYDGKVIDASVGGVSGCWSVEITTPQAQDSPVTVNQVYDDCLSCAPPSSSSSSSSHSSSVPPPKAASGGGGFGTGLV